MRGRPASESLVLQTSTANRLVERLGFMSISDAELPPAVLPSPAFHGYWDDAGTRMQGGAIPARQRQCRNSTLRILSRGQAAGVPPRLARP